MAQMSPDELELERCRQDILDVKTELKTLSDAINKTEEGGENRTKLEAERVVVRSDLVELRKKENLLLLARLPSASQASPAPQVADMQGVVKELQTMKESLEQKIGGVEQKIGGVEQKIGGVEKQLEQQQVALDDLKSGSMIDDKTLNLLRNSVFPLGLDGGKNYVPIGVMFFVSDQYAVTANHNVERKHIGDSVYIQRPSDRRPHMLVVCFKDDARDFALLKSAQRVHFYLPLVDTKAQPPQQGKNFLLAAYQIGIAEELQNEFKVTFGTMLATVTKTSENHMVFQSTTYAGDSGAALTLLNGNVIGVHIANVNEARERLRGKTDFSLRLNEVEQSIDRLIQGTAQGCIGVLAHVITAALPREQ